MQLEGELPWDDGQGADKSDKENPDKKNHKKLINAINEKPGAWYILPFELRDSSNVFGSGNLRLLFDSGKLLKLINLDCVYQKNRYLFSLHYENGKCRTVRFNTGENDEIEKKTETELKKLFLAADMGGIEVLRAEKTDIEGNAALCESIYTFGGEV